MEYPSRADDSTLSHKKPVLESLAVNNTAKAKTVTAAAVKVIDPRSSEISVVTSGSNVFMTSSPAKKRSDSVQSDVSSNYSEDSVDCDGVMTQREGDRDMTSPEVFPGAPFTLGVPDSNGDEGDNGDEEVVIDVPAFLRSGDIDKVRNVRQTPPEIKLAIMADQLEDPPASPTQLSDDEDELGDNKGILGDLGSLQSPDKSDNGTAGGDAKANSPSANSPLQESHSDSGFYEDREFDFLKTEKVRRSTSLKTYKTPPGTPSRKKAVRFADALGLDLESVRNILDLDAPPRVPASALRDLQTGVEEEHREEGAKYLRACFSQPGALPDFILRVRAQKVIMENCVVDDKNMTVTGTVRVHNIAYHKTVTIRYTVNNWLTHEDIKSNYIHDSNDGCTDRFSFTINVPPYFGVGNRMELAIMYNAGGQTYWDSNYGANYCIECYAKAPTTGSDTQWMTFL